MEAELADLGRSADRGSDGEDFALRLEVYTFLATDIAGSSELFRRYPAEMIRAMDRHDAILHDTILDLDGDPFKHTGDGVVAVFEDPLQAVRAAVESQRRMRAESWPVTGRPRIRWGVFTGPARPRGGDFFGPALSGVSRLEEAANPDQILLSQETLERCRDGLEAAGLSVRDLGVHHFKGMDRARIYQVGAEGLPDQFGPLGGKRETAHGNLPAEINSFVGRTRELAALSDLMADGRIVTLLGPGGIGKTRLAVELARRAGSEFADGAWLLNLSALDPGVDLWPVLASVFSLDTTPVFDKRATVLTHLAEARALIVIDNCEHMLDGVSDLVTTLISDCPGVSVICTSQRALAVPGEALYEVPALSHDSATSAAVQLFVDRARLIRKDFEPDEAELETIRSICVQLENIPLAIEIAAGQLRRYPLSHIAGDAARPERMRASGRRGRQDSDRTTLRRTFNWSYGLLDETSQKVLERLSVFSGLFHEEQALEVCGLDIEDEIDILDGIDELIDASLLAAQFDSGRRFRMLLTVRAFGREKLAEQDLLEAFQSRHGEVYARRSAMLGDRFATEAELEVARAVPEELDNLRAAFERALQGDLGLAARIAAPLNLYNYYHRGAETAGWPARVMAQAGADALAEAPLLLASAASYSLHELGEDETARAYLERGFRAERSGVGTSRGWLSHVAGHVAIWSGHPDEFMTHRARAVVQARNGDAPDIALEVIDTATAAYLCGTRKDEQRARTLVADLDRLAHEVRQPSLVGYVHFGRAGLAMAAGSDRVVDELKAAMQWGEIGGNALGAQRAKRALTETLARGAAPQRQIDLQIALLKELPQQGATIYVWLTINSLIAPLAALGRHEAMATLAGAVSVSPVHLGKRAEASLDAARAALGETAFEAAFERGTTFGQKQARAFAETLNGAQQDRDR